MKNRQRLVILGDSVTAAGRHQSDGEAWCYVDILNSRISSEGVPAELTASALDGIDTGYAIRRFRRMVTALEPDQVLVMLGLNDAQPAGGRTKLSPADFKANLGLLVELILEIDAVPILVTPNPRFDHPVQEPASGDLMPPYVQAMRDVAETYMIYCIDVHQQFCGVEALDDLIPDGVHPAPDGHRIIAETIAEHLIPLLRNDDAVAPARHRGSALNN